MPVLLTKGWRACTYSRGVDVAELIFRHPTLYHLADSRSWAGIEAHGLLSTTALLDLFEIAEPERVAIEAERRPESVPLRHVVHGTALVRDNKPMTTKALEKCLTDGVNPNEWYRMLNRRVFFWLTEGRVDRLLQAKAYRGSTHLVLAVDTSSLVRTYSDVITLSPINSGATLYNPQPRGATTFLPIADYPWQEHRRRRGPQDAIAELTVDYAVPDIIDHITEVRLRLPDGSSQRVR